MKQIVCFFALLFSTLGGPLMAQHRSEAVEVKVEKLQATPMGVSVTLRTSDSRQSVQMMIGFSEGQSIARAMRQEGTSRPMTHDLFKIFLDRNGWRVQKVLIRTLESGTFLADLTLEHGQETQVYDARPSDAMAIGLRYGAKIYVNKEVFEQQKEYQGEPEELKPSEPETLRL